MHKFRPLLVALLGASSSFAFQASRPLSAAAVSCAGQPDGDADFNGNKQSPLAHPLGTAATIQAVSFALCSGTNDTFSSAWIAIEGGAVPPGFNILQIGYDKCRGGACGPTSPTNTLYYFWAYGRNPGGSCGAEIAPVPVDLGNASAGAMPRFKIERAPSSRAYHYELYIGATLEAYVFIGDVENCWTGGSVRSSFFNEVYDLGTQSGGRVGDQQDFQDVQYKTDTWYLMTRALNASCDYVDRTTQRCHTGSSDSNNYFTYDTRFP
jgi:hypothetical protein